MELAWGTEFAWENGMGATGVQTRKLRTEVRTEVPVGAERRYSATTDGIDAALCESRRCATAVLCLRATA